MKTIMNWCNTNSGFITALGILFGSGVLSSYISLPNINDLVRDLTSNKLVKQHKALYILQNIRSVMCFIGKVALRFSFLAMLLLFIIISIFSSEPNRNNVNKLIDNGDNRIFIESQDVLDRRVLVPEQSLYSDIDMLAIQQINRDVPSWDAVTSEFTTDESDKEGLINELEAEILKNPLVGDMIAQGLNVLIRNNIQSNPLYGNTGDEWIDSFYEQNEKEYKDNGTGLNRWIKTYTFEDGNIGTYVTDEYRIYAEHICEYLNSLSNYGVRELVPEIRYYRNHKAGLNGLRAVHKYEDEEKSIKALVLGFPGQIDEGHIIGFALEDKSLLIYLIYGLG